MKLLRDISQALQKGDVNKVKSGIEEALQQGVETQQILEEGLLSAMDIIGTKFKNNEIFVPEVLIAVRAMNAGMELLKPRLVEAGIKPIGHVVLGTVKGDLHDIGKNLVRMMLEGAGMAVHDLGVDVSAEKFVEAVKQYNPQIVGMSALLTTTMGEMSKVITAIKDAGMRSNLKIMVGGAPITSRFAVEIGADAYCKNAAEAASVAKELVLK